MKVFHNLLFYGLFILSSCGANENVKQPFVQAVAGNNNQDTTASADDDVSSHTLIFKHQLCYKYMDEVGNTGEYEIVYQPATGIMYVAVADNIPMIDGVLIYPDATYKVLGQNENGEKVSITFTNGQNLVVELKDEEGVVYPKDHPYTDYQLNEGNALVYTDGIKGSEAFIKSKMYTVTYERTGDYMNLYVTDAYPQLNARLLYGLALVPGDVGEFFKRFGELWNISSSQWPTLISGQNYSVEMNCFSATDYHVDPTLYKEERPI